jgi:hypothetical protein
MNHLHTVCLAFIHHGGRAGGIFLFALLAVAVLAVVMLATADKSK